MAVLCGSCVRVRRRSEEGKHTGDTYNAQRNPDKPGEFCRGIVQIFTQASPSFHVGNKLYPLLTPNTPCSIWIHHGWWPFWHPKCKNGTAMGLVIRSPSDPKHFETVCFRMSEIITAFPTDSNRISELKPKRVGEKIASPIIRMFQPNNAYSHGKILLSLIACAPAFRITQ
jgi:hypothetical protein